MTISIIGLDEKAEQDNFIIRELSQSSYRIEESDTLIEIIENNTMMVMTVVINNTGNKPPKAKVTTKEYLYRTKAGHFLKFTVQDYKLIVAQIH